MAAAKSKGVQGIASLGKRAVFSQIWTANSTRTPSAAAAATLIRSAAQHTSAYDKNVDDQVLPSVVPDDVIQPQSDKYWSPHPQTGVFGPATDHKPVAGSVEEFLSSRENLGEDLEEKAWFRPTGLQDVEKPHHP